MGSQERLYSKSGENIIGTWRETEKRVAFCIFGTQENERAQRGTWQVREVHRMSVLSSVPGIRSSGGWVGIRMEVPAQHSGAVAPPVAGRIGVAKGKW